MGSRWTRRTLDREGISGGEEEKERTYRLDTSLVEMRCRRRENTESPLAALELKPLPKAIVHDSPFLLLPASPPSQNFLHL